MVSKFVKNHALVEILGIMVVQKISASKKQYVGKILAILNLSRNLRHIGQIVIVPYVLSHADRVYDHVTELALMVSLGTLDVLLINR
jgi:hypothetical protein